MQMMAINASKDLNDTFAEHLEALRGYAKKVLGRGDALTAAEQIDERARISQLVLIGHTFRLTDKDMVAMIFKGILQEPRRCGCPTCRSRRESNGV